MWWNMHRKREDLNANEKRSTVQTKVPSNDNSESAKRSNIFVPSTVQHGRHKRHEGKKHIEQHSNDVILLTNPNLSNDAIHADQLEPEAQTSSNDNYTSLQVSYDHSQLSVALSSQESNLLQDSNNVNSTITKNASDTALGDNAAGISNISSESRNLESTPFAMFLEDIYLGPNMVSFTRQRGRIGSACNESSFVIKNIPVKNHGTKTSEIQLPTFQNKLLGPSWFLCTREENATSFLWNYVGWFEQYSTSDNGFRGNYKMFSTDIKGSKIFGLRAEGDRVYITDDGRTKIPANVLTTFRMFGMNFSNHTELAFTTSAQPTGTLCENLPITLVLQLHNENVISDSVLEVNVILPLPYEGSDSYYICLKDNYEKGESVKWVHQGNDPWIRIEPFGRILPMWIQIFIICFLLILSGLFSGLNLGLMAMNKTELAVLEQSKDDTEQRYAKIISPLRKKGNYLLCSLLLGNVLVNSSLTILLDDLTSGIIAIVGSTISIVVFGEIIPQAICSRHGLLIGAKTVWITKFFMLATFPLSLPISKILDCVLGEEIGHVYDRERLVEFILQQQKNKNNNLESEEVNMIKGALSLKSRTVTDVMTKIEDVFMIPRSTILNFETVSKIIKMGYTRVPVYEIHRDNIIGLLNVRDMALLDPDNNTPLMTLCNFYNHPINFVFEDKTLDSILSEFKAGKSRMAFVHHVNSSGECDPYYEMIGVVTLADVIEHIIQSEILDETDVISDNWRKQRRRETERIQDYTAFAKLGTGQQGTNLISPQLALATYQFLSTGVEPFYDKYLSKPVLKRLMSQNIYFKTKPNENETTTHPSCILYEIGKVADYFILILEGHCLVTATKEKMVFETGAFHFFGVPAITVSLPDADLSPPRVSGSTTSQTSLSSLPEFSTPKSFLPDYTAVAVTETLYMKISWSVYIAAVKATMVERQHRFDSDDNRTESSSTSEILTPLSFSPPRLQPESTSAHATPTKISSNLNSAPLSSIENLKNRHISIETGSKQEPALIRKVSTISSELPKSQESILKFTTDVPLSNVTLNKLESVVEDDSGDSVESVVPEDDSGDSVESVVPEDISDSPKKISANDEDTELSSEHEISVPLNRAALSSSNDAEKCVNMGEITSEDSNEKVTEQTKLLYPSES